MRSASKSYHCPLECVLFFVIYLQQAQDILAVARVNSGAVGAKTEAIPAHFGVPHATIEGLQADKDPQIPNLQHTCEIQRHGLG